MTATWLIRAGRALWRRRPRRRPASRWDQFVSMVTPESLGQVALDAVGRRALFKRNVRLVELEPHAYCNRVCSFCPNSTIDRRTIKARMAADMYNRVLADLASIRYDGVLRFGRYSEPMADEHIYDLVAQARERLPATNIDIVTNGDYLNRGSVERLRAAGLSVLRISVYLRDGIEWSVDASRDEILRLARRLQIDPTFHDATADTVGANFDHPGIEVVAYCHDFDRTGYDRGQLLPSLTDHAYVRRAPCSLVFTNLTVDFDGKVMPCCNLRGDDAAHREFVVGDLAAEQSVFDVYAGSALAGWRLSLAGVGPKGDPCRTCKQKTADGDELVRLENLLRPRLTR